MRLAKMLASRATTRGTDVDVPRTFLGFCKWLGVTLTPGQSELARVAYDGAEPVDRDIAGRLFGESLPMGARPIVAAVCGARAGKSYVLVALRLVFGMLVRDVSTVPPGPHAAALIIAPRDDLRQEVFRYALGAVRSKPELARMLDDVKGDVFTLRRPDGKCVDFKTGVATAGGTGARGQWWTDFALDECAFFRDGSYKVNDEELFRAGSARVLPGGQTIIASTPWAEAGLLHRLWKSRPDDVLVAHAPTLALNDSEVTRAIVKRAEEADPDNAKREFGAVFMTSGTTVFFESSSIDLATTGDPFVAQPGDLIAAGADLGFRSDSSALLLVAMRGNTLHVFDGREERPTDDKPLKPSTTIASFAKCIAGRCSYVMADSHYREAVTEHLDTHNLIYAPAPLTPADTYVRARMLFREGRVRIHPLPFRERLIQQAREVHGRPTSGGGMSIVHPRWATGGHGDLVAAMVLALWQASGDMIVAPPPEQGSKEWEQRLVDQRHRTWQAEQGRPEWARRQPADRGRVANWRR